MFIRKLASILTVVMGMAMSLSQGAYAESPHIIIAGPAEAEVTIQEFSDFECPYCEKGSMSIEEVIKRYPGKVRIIFRNFPLEFHKSSGVAAKYFAAVYLQRPDLAYLWQKQVFVNQNRLSSEGIGFLDELAKKFELNIDQLKRDAEGAIVKSMLERDKQLAYQLSIKGTPSFLIGNKLLVGAQPFEEFKKLIDDQLK